MNTNKVRADIRAAFAHFPMSGLLNLRNNRKHLIRKAYQRDDDGCLFNLVSQGSITCKNGLTEHFTGGSGFPFYEEEVYQPARHLIRLWDGGTCEMVKERYEIGEDEVVFLDEDFVFNVLEEIIIERMAIEAEAEKNERRVSEKVAEKV